MRIAVDVDGVLARRVPAILDLIATRHGVRLDVSAITDREATIPLTGRDLSAFYAETDEQPEHLLALDPVEGAADAMRALAEEHELLIATYRKPAAMDPTIEWLDEHAIPFDTYVREVGEGKRAVDADVLVDDSARTAAAFAEERPEARAVLFSRPWNADAATPDAVRRVADWSAVRRYVDSLSPTEHR